MRNVRLVTLVVSTLWYAHLWHTHLWYAHGHPHTLPPIHAKSRIIQHLGVFNAAPEKPLGGSDPSQAIAMAERTAEILTEMSKIELLRAKGFPAKVIVSVEDTGSVEEVSVSLKTQLKEYGAELDGVMTALKMFVLKFPPPDQEAKPLDVNAFEIIKATQGVKFYEVDSIVEAL
eukprot:Gregarina_sp_Pseudo_9__2556@NODE_2824_length_858_cov_35_517705_g2584_i0_p1_GENE_NODE_2824_length_858_cov_35_517705_g2584_i0NODE_2824_length_858_cov_35_517705_g2584_i0_p1_ORF_typecomplete_len174_score44_22_NODE_2824_length_858_cov_35_517705_g2584_i084605